MASIRAVLNEPEEDDPQTTLNKAENNWDAVDGNIQSAFVYQLPQYAGHERSIGPFNTPTCCSHIVRADRRSPSPSPTQCAAMPSTPTKAHATPTSAAASPAIVPGGQFEMPPKQALCVAEPQEEVVKETKVYILFDGIDHFHGVFTSYRTTFKTPGIEEHVKGYNNTVFKAFCMLEIVEKCYQEAKDTGMLDVLHHKTEWETVYVVIQGVKPGMYIRWGLLIKEGLDWRGRVVMFAIGSASQGRAAFNQWKNTGKVSLAL
ncbi:hypothetical protein BT96DRAFT_945352 [Gymnopus androsaceus JB14]|uniref:Uncharacterized protein n=1 Tax=Gymnopus androsaceus JB14 TaxID=1447944 RepID=A0A6A4H155_9AGAR|nr:hypothetical protein BT96DRAFT_945352 [Gymnopus androsaceus JB14]